jgi:NADH:ubiquinone oxidoreductase subunit F (NADH-binding)
MTLNSFTRIAPAAVDPRRSLLRTGPSLLLHPVRLDRSGPADPWEPTATERLDNLLSRSGSRPRGTTDLVHVLEREGLTGHGGAHVPTAAKWRAALGGRGPLTVVANGAESEPLSAKDAILLQQRPHLVLDGLALTAEALGAHRAVVWLHGSDAPSRAAVQAAIAERRAARLDEPVLEVVTGPTHYLAGESSAIAQALNGGPTLPTARRRTVTPETADRPRTLVQNVETLARLALIARGYPPMATMVLTVLTPVGREVLEVNQGTPVTEVLEATGWLRTRPPKAVLLGGFGGMWVRWHDIERVTFDEAGLRTIGLSAGAGIVAPIPAGACGIAETAAIAEYLASMSARQCGPCLFGLPALTEGMRLLATGTATRRDRIQVRRDLRAVAGRGACHHPDGAIRLIASSLAVFEHDVAQHAHRRPCTGSGETTLPVPRSVA